MRYILKISLLSNFVRLFLFFSSRPRYTCIHFTQEEETILQFQICKCLEICSFQSFGFLVTKKNVFEPFSARSRQTDESFHMCHFHDDPVPLGPKVRSSVPKSLLCKSLKTELEIQA